MTRDLAVVIPHFHDYVRLDRCLEELKACEGRDWTDVVVVHSGSTVPDIDFARRHSDVRFLHDPTPGAGPARNTGVAACSAPFLLFLDSDCRPAKDLLIEARRQISNADIIGGRIDLFDETPGNRSGAEAFEAVFAFRQKMYVTKKKFAATANLLTTRDVFADVGPFSSATSEDRDWCLRARGLGYTIAYAPSMRVKHPSRGTWESLTMKWGRLVREELALTRNSSIFTLRWTAKCMALPLSLLADLPRVWFCPRLNGPSERILGSWTLIKLRFWRMKKMLKMRDLQPTAAQPTSK